MCDQISDAILDAHLREDPDAKVACGGYFWCYYLIIIVLTAGFLRRAFDIIEWYS